MCASQVAWHLSLSPGPAPGSLAPEPGSVVPAFSIAVAKLGARGGILALAVKVVAGNCLELAQQLDKPFKWELVIQLHRVDIPFSMKRFRLPMPGDSSDDEPGHQLGKIPIPVLTMPVTKLKEYREFREDEIPDRLPNQGRN